MTIEEAKTNIGKQFKWLGSTTGLTSNFDTIKHVSSKGIVYGSWLAAHHDDCRLKTEQPEHLKRESCDTHS